MSISGLFALRYPPPIPCIARLLGLCLPHMLTRNSLMGGTLRISAGISLTLDLLIPSFYTRKHLDLPSFRVTPVNTCPALRPRWCPDRIAIARSALLPSNLGTLSAFTLSALFTLKGYPYDHHHTWFRGSITQPASLIHPASYSRLRACTWASLLTCWLSFSQVGLFRLSGRCHPPGNNDRFHGPMSNSNASDLPWHDPSPVGSSSFPRRTFPCSPRLKYSPTYTPWHTGYIPGSAPI